MKLFRYILVLGFLNVTNLQPLRAQHLVVPDNLVSENIPGIPASIVKEVKPYTESRGASLSAWHPKKREMIIATRFANSNQLHYLKTPEGARQQITFFDEPVSSCTFEPENGSYIILSKDNGGDEFAQLYRYDYQEKKTQLLSDGKRSQNGGMRWNRKGDQMVYTSTKRNGKDRDFYLMDPANPSSEKLISENNGGGWGMVDWAMDDKSLLIQEGISVNESRLYRLDIATGKKEIILPEKEERSTYRGIGFSKKNNGFYFISNKDREFNTLAYYDLSNKSITWLSDKINWDVEDAEISKVGNMLAFVTNENGLSKLYLLSESDKKVQAADNLPVGIIRGIEWAPDSKSIGFTFVSYNSSSDVYEYNLSDKKLIRWTYSETGEMNLSNLQAPELIKWKSFDGLEISGFMYKASSQFKGKRPVIISIHGGPEAQSRPQFPGSSNYYLNELGITIIYPNVRGSTGYGKTFVDLDNGYNRENSVKDIGALLDWIATQPELDKDRVMVTGGSYGGYMTLAVSVHYSDRIRCAIDVVGISNFVTFLNNTESYRRDLRRVEYGDERDPEMKAFQERISPLNHTDKIKKPLFIVQGKNDPRVPYTEAEQMKNKIKESGGTVWYLMANDEGHGFRKKNNSDFQFYATISFIRTYLLN
jgi:dipeptidyl aminopeptidase/acylaminoacyl peptidase